MEYSIKRPIFVATTKHGIAAAKILDQELFLRTGKSFFTEYADGDFSFIFSETAALPRDAFRIGFEGNALVFAASGIRGFLFAVGLFLRKSVYKNGAVLFSSALAGDYAPQKPIRGHQLGYRHCANSYDAWSPSQFRRYSLELMYFGMNTVEHIPKTADAPKAPLMALDENELLQIASEDADELDLDVSLWIPNDEEDLASAVKKRERIFRNTKRINAVFIPGSDPGDLPADALFAHCAAISDVLKLSHPKAKLWVSAQAPHDQPDWGEEFLKALEAHPDAADGVITGPNRAFPIDELRRRIPARYPLRFYPDITHNVRCEHPVHFLRDDWHYTYAACLSRECCNPRPAEYALLHRLTAPYTVGSVSYSEGINDDLNKAVWSALEWNADTPLREILRDYARLYFYGADTETAADALAGLELNWNAPPELNPQIDLTLSLWTRLGEETPLLYDNWRFVQCLFRARCDAYIRKRVLFENSLLETAKRRIREHAADDALSLLNTPYPPEIAALRNEIDRDADRLNKLIGAQLSVSRHGASGWERGAVLDTVDLPVTDLPWLKTQLEKAKTAPDPAGFLLQTLHRNTVAPDEFYFSVALHGLSVLGCPQNGEFYMDFQGDRPNVNNGTLPVCLQKLYDHLSFRCRCSGFAPGRDYRLRVTYKNKPNRHTTRHRITANGRLIYEGGQFGGQTDAAFTAGFLPEGFIAVSYPLPAGVFENGCLTLEITEPETGFELAELYIIKEEERRK